MYSIWDVTYDFLLDFANNNLVGIVILCLMFSVFGFCFFNKR